MGFGYNFWCIARSYGVSPRRWERSLAFAALNDLSPSLFASALLTIALSATGRYELPTNRAVLLQFERLSRAFAELDTTGAISVTERDLDFSRVTINVRFAPPDELFGSNEHTAGVLERIDALAAEHLSRSLGPRDMWSWVAAIVNLPSIMLRDQIVAAAVALVLVFAVSTVGFRSAIIGALVLVPMVAGVMLNFIPLELARMRFDAVSVMFTSVAVGVGVDHAIHFLLQFRTRWRAASRRAARHAGPQPCLLYTSPSPRDRG